MIERLRLPFIALLTVLTCLCIHEVGHTVAARLSGARVTEFSIFTLRPHVRVAGPATLQQEEFRSVAGSGFFALVYLGFLLLTSGTGEIRQLTRLIASCHAVAELLGWISTCLLPTTETSPDDAAYFLAVSKADRAEVAWVCAAIGLFLLLVWRLTQPKRPLPAAVTVHTGGPQARLIQHAAQQ